MFKGNFPDLNTVPKTYETMNRQKRGYTSIVFLCGYNLLVLENSQIYL